METSSQNYVRKYSQYENDGNKLRSRISQREKQIVRLKKRLENLAAPSWIDKLLKPIAEAMLKYLPDRYYDILGPFGMTAETSIHFYKKGCNGSIDGDNCKSLTVRPTNLDIGELSLVDYAHDTHRYAKGTMGEVNGMNYPIIPMKSSIKELVDFLN